MDQPQKTNNCDSLPNQPSQQNAWQGDTCFERGNRPQEGETDKHFLFQPPVINLPKGGGAIQGMGEKLQANPVTCTGSMTVPIAMSLDRGGVTPQLALS